MVSPAMESEDGKSNQLRQEMVDRLKNLRLVRSEPVEEALRTVPRHLFVPRVDVGTAYSDQAVVTRWQDGRAISSASAPSIVALMLELLDLRPGQRVLEIGAGTGYNAALMARLVGESGQVVTIDIDDEIVQEARAHLKAVGIENVQVMCGDGALGWAEGAPYDRVILTASVTDLMPAWHEQLVRGGRL
ncbi:MAG TPA: methyltransferase domain-containing protein, partial [Ktedonobacteraceae bacterium]|nr:methyltransferase domain-containing protein [Ktedonobacteraceae bacterium]